MAGVRTGSGCESRFRARDANALFGAEAGGHARKEDEQSWVWRESRRKLFANALEAVLLRLSSYADVLEDEYEDGTFEDEYLEDDAEVYVGDGGGGGGISLAGTWWDKKALAIAEQVSQSFDGDLKIYAFKTLLNCTIQVRIENLSKRSGSPSMEDIEAFSATYRARLDEAEAAKSVPENLSLEVSSPGVERVVGIPHDFDRFMDRPMFVKYVLETDSSGSSSEGDGIFKLISVDTETKCCTWGLANVRANREKAGKGRPLSKKQREWRLTTSFELLRLVRIYSEI
ncbi:uncharacterized protein LOC115684653 [Syzygium oleosum]|uniref:uncharacterized protein LOC115684653 n=1 Tax=Syzygium oleosum TaxID=219896 RepID=UPI0024B8946E|nr:uncharacterized protein LOC115684653 [Syzygium oleosum]